MKDHYKFPFREYESIMIMVMNIITINFLEDYVNLNHKDHREHEN